jgi:hypothetical protein
MAFGIARSFCTAALVALMAAAPLAAQTPSKPHPKLSMRQARTLALKRERGQIKTGELEFEKGRWIYSFDIGTAKGIREVNVDANSGKIVEDSAESAAAEAQEQREENAHRSRSH